MELLPDSLSGKFQLIPFLPDLLSKKYRAILTIRKKDPILPRAKTLRFPFVPDLFLSKSTRPPQLFFKFHVTLPLRLLIIRVKGNIRKEITR